MTPEERATKIVEDFREKEVANEGPTHDYCVEAIAAAIREHSAQRKLSPADRDVLLKVMTKPLYQMDLQQRMVPGERTDAEYEEEWEHWRTCERHKRHLPMHHAHERANAVLLAMEISGFSVLKKGHIRQCAHTGYSFAKDGRRCPHCLEMLTDFGD